MSVARCTRDALWTLPGGAVVVVLHGVPCPAWPWLGVCPDNKVALLLFDWRRHARVDPRAVARYSRITFLGAIVAPHCGLPGLQETCSFCGESKAFLSPCFNRLYSS